MNPGGREFECLRTNEVYEVFMSSNSVSALSLGSVIHSVSLFFYLATHRKRRGSIVYLLKYCIFAICVICGWFELRNSALSSARDVVGAVQAARSMDT